MKPFFPGSIWRVPKSNKVVYLTFDDGPQPGITDFVLSTLDRFDAKATFFVVGENAETHPDLVEKIKAAGHLVANHTFNHLNGWKTANEDYYENIRSCEEVIQQPTHRRLFRPPYGKISPRQLRAVKKDYRVIMWDVLSRDFEPSTGSANCLKICKKYTRNGSIVVFHDSKKAEDNLTGCLVEYLEYLKENSYSCEVLNLSA